MPAVIHFLLRSLTILLALLAASGASAQGTPVDLELVLAVDVSRSIDDEEYALQKQGYAQAFLNPAVLGAILSTANHRIAVTMVEWGAADQQRIVTPWTVVSDAESAAVLSETIMRAPRSYVGFTSISGAIDFSARLFGQGYTGTRRVIDVSGDGVNNSGRSTVAARDDALNAGIIINGLVIMNDRPDFGFFRQTQIPLDQFYRDNVIGGPGAFLIAVEDFESFAYAIVNKLVREIAAAPGDGRVSVAGLKPR